MYFPGGEERDVDGDGPRCMDERTVRYWCRHTKELKGAQVKKAELFVLYDCLQYLGENRFICLPLNTAEEFVLGDRVFRKKAWKTDYNSSEYVIQRRGEKTFECNCQGWQTKARRGEIIPEGANCSHVLGLFYAFKLKRFAPRQKTMEVQYGILEEAS
jgi:hypothetical protein